MIQLSDEEYAAHRQLLAVAYDAIRYVEARRDAASATNLTFLSAMSSRDRMLENMLATIELLKLLPRRVVMDAIRRRESA